MLERPDTCIGCPLHDNGLATGFMTTEGTGTNHVMIVGEALGENEARDGLPFRPKAQAGSSLERAITRMALDRQAFVLANMVWCQPKGNALEGEWYEQQAIEHCSQYLDGAIKRFRPRTIIALGNIPLRYLTGNAGKDRTISSLRGYVFDGIGVAAGIPIVPSYHPSFISRGGETYLGVLMHDIGRAVKIATGRLVEGSTWISDVDDAIAQGILDYKFNPSGAELDRWLEEAISSDWPITYDIETDWTAKGNKNEEEYGAGQGGNITQIQFSHLSGSAIVLPWNRPGVFEFVRHVFGLPKTFVAHNGWRFDRPRLRAAGLDVPLGHDSMVAWHHIQPDLPADLQFVASMYNFPYPWKHLGVASPVYGAADVDSVQRVWAKLLGDMKKRGVWDSYQRYVVALQPMLERMQERGIHIDLAERAKFRKVVEDEKVRVNAAIQDAVPGELKPINPKEGYKVWTTAMIAVRAQHLERHGVNRITDLDAVAFEDLQAEITHKFGLYWKPFYPQGKNSPAVVRPYEQLPFLAQSTAHLKALIKYNDVKVPKNLDGDETTARVELERLIAKLRKDANTALEKAEKPRARNVEKYITDANKWNGLASILENCISYRQLTKINSYYIDGWPTDTNGLVHTTYTFHTATWQLSSVEPNVQNGIKHSELAKPWLRTLTSRPGHTLVNFDYKACHMLTMAREARDKSYERAARTDGHSILAANILKLHGCAFLLDKTDDELREYVKWFKSDPERKALRDGPAKKTLLGNQLGLGAKKLYDMNIEHFKNKAEAAKIQELLDKLFPKVAAWKKYIKELAHRQGYLISRYGGIRWFWSVLRWDAKRGGYTSGEDAEAAMAFFVQNHAFGKMREAMLEINEKGLDELFWLNNTIHDSLEFDCPDELVERCKLEIAEIMRKPAMLLADAELWPEGLGFDVEVSVGKNKAPYNDDSTKGVINLDGMREVKV